MKYRILPNGAHNVEITKSDHCWEEEHGLCSEIFNTVEGPISCDCICHLK